MRGKVCLRLRVHLVVRITPACAGKSSSNPVHQRFREDHPRVCGEKKNGKIYDGKALGSPPRVRGKAARLPLVLSGARITPACAGKRAPNSKHPPVAEDHPRVCGEKEYLIYRKLFDEGSPPRVRGKVLLLCLGMNRLRITPACAGKSYINQEDVFSG